MSADKIKIAKDLWKNANQALAREQWEYAVENMFKAMVLVPDNLVYRQTLRGASKKLYGDNGSGARMAGMKTMKIKGRIKKAKLTKDWKGLDHAAEEGLRVNPWDAALNAAVGEACVNLGFADVALFSYELALKADPESKDYNRQYALLQEERGNYNDAISAWNRVFKIDPNDQEARSKVTQLQANTVMRRGGYEDAKSTQEMKTAYDFDRKSAAKKQPGQQQADGPGMSVEADLQRAIRKDPSDVGSHLKLADLYKREKRLDEAAEMLETALQISGGDATIREQLEDVELDRMRHNHELAKEAFRANPKDETAKRNAVGLGKEILLREIEVLSKRVERYPKDAKLKFELAQRHMQSQAFAKAIPLLQQAAADSRIECEVLVKLGDCFHREKKPALALRQFEKAKDIVNVHEKPDLFKAIHYALGVLNQAAGNKEKAELHFQEVLGVDYEYRDTLKRLEDLQSGE